ncbi:MAG: TIGR00725 family protein [Acidimicrobiales bacterium]
MTTIAVIGPGEADEATESQAERIGADLATAGVVLVCGGLGGVMEAACRGARRHGGITIGLLPGDDPSAANPYIQVALPTGLGELRNGLIVRAADAVIAVAGEYGTLSEIALALKLGRPVVGVGTWSLSRPDGQVDDGIWVAGAADAVPTALRLISEPA